MFGITKYILNREKRQLLKKKRDLEQALSQVSRKNDQLKTEATEIKAELSEIKEASSEVITKPCDWCLGDGSSLQPPYPCIQCGGTGTMPI